MRQWQIKWIALALFAGTGCFAYSADVKKSKPTPRLVEIQWGEAENAKQYIVEVRHYQGAILKTFNSKKPLLRFKAPIGDYELRAKVEGIDGRIGEFSEWNRITVLPRPVVFKGEPERKVVEADSKKLTGDFRLTWPAEETAKEYNVKILAADDSVVQELSLDSLGWEVDLPPGEYRYSVTSVNGKFKSEPAMAPQTLVVESAQLGSPEVGVQDTKGRPIITWKTTNGVTYRVTLEFHPFMAEKFEPVQNVPEPVNGRWTPAENAVPGEYRLSIWADAKGFKSGAPIVRAFEIKPTEPDLSTVDKDLAQAFEPLSLTTKFYTGS